jgi:hypothetical protein
LSQKRQFFAEFFSENILKIITLVPDRENGCLRIRKKSCNEKLPIVEIAKIVFFCCGWGGGWQCIRPYI